MLPNAVLSDLRIHVRVLKPDGWAVERFIPLQMPGAGLSLREVMEAVLDDERQRRLTVPPGLQDETSLIQALDSGGTRTPPEGQLRHPPPLSELLSRAEQALRDGLILVVLNDAPWKEWESPRLLPDPSSLWIARTVWLQQHTWS